MRSLIYCDFVDPKADNRPYTEVPNVDKLRVTVEGFLDEFNNISKKPMNLVLFRYVNTLAVELSSVSESTLDFNVIHVHNVTCVCVCV